MKLDKSIKEGRKPPSLVSVAESSDKEGGFRNAPMHQRTWSFGDVERIDGICSLHAGVFFRARDIVVIEGIQTAKARIRRIRRHCLRAMQSSMLRVLVVGLTHELLNFFFKTLEIFSYGQ